MKRIFCLFFCLMIILLVPGCGDGDVLDRQGFGTVSVTDVNTSTQGSSYEIRAELSPFKLSDFGEGYATKLEAEWQSYRDMGSSVIFSSHIWGLCYHYTETWSECISFVGRNIDNPLEICSWLSAADNYASEPISETNSNHCEITWHGSEDGALYHSTVTVGYLADEVRVSMSATFNGASDGLYTTGAAWTTCITFATEDYLMANGNTALIITPGSTGFSSAKAYFVQDDILYAFTVTGSGNESAEVRHILEKILALYD